MDTAKIEAIYQLSPVQQGMLFHSLQAPGSGVYIEQLSCTIQGDLDPSALEQAWQQVIDRHPILRTSFVWEQIEQPVQVVQRRVQLGVEQQDWRQDSSDQQAARLAQLLADDRRQGFELVRAPLMRLRLLRLDETRYQFIWSYHHLLLDGWATALVLKEVFDRYAAIQRNQAIQPPPSRPYRDYISWLQRQDLAAAESFWRATLQGVTAPTPLVVDRVAPAGQTSDSTHQQIALSAEVTTRLQAFARQHQLTLNTLVQGVWAMLLHRYSGERDIVFGVTVAGRPAALPGAEAMIGLFINTLPVRAQIQPDAQLLPWLKAFQDRQVELRQYEWSPLAQVQSWSDAPRGAPLFESILVFENYPIDDALGQLQGGLQFRDVAINERTNYPLTVIVMPKRELTLRIMYDRGRFDDQIITRMLEHLRALLYSVSAQPMQRLSDLSLMSRLETQQLLVGWNQTATRYDQVAILHELIEAQAARTPDATAVVFEDARLSYAELNARANQLAHTLRGRGVGPETLVGICVERSLELVVGLLGILKAGGAYVPLDPGYPADRLQFMVEDAGAPVLLTQAHLGDLLAETLDQLARRDAAPHVLRLDADWPAIAHEPTADPINRSLPDQLAYMIYTSGSTGRPKGAMNTHAAICNRLLWMQAEYGLTAADRVLQKTPFSFDVSVWEFFWPLIAGAQIVLARPEGHKDSAYLVELIQRRQITTLHFVPSMLQAFVAEDGLERCASLKRVICSGEALPYDLQQRFFARLDAELHNLYGPTEAAVDVSYWACQRDSSQPIVPIGRPVANTQLYVLDAQLQPVPVGVAGELYIGGVQLARGYLNRPALTAEKFIPNPFLKDESGSFRLYKTGDVVRWLLDGSIEYLGRADQQVKLRGFRIELGEIESALRQLPAIRDAAVLLRADDGSAPRLVAYVVGEEPRTGAFGANQEPGDGTDGAQVALAASVSGAELRSFLAERLPEYMIPAAFVTLPALPLTPSGKLDRRALPAPETNGHMLRASFVAPRTPTEELLAGIWQHALGVAQVGVHDSFFELGGDSIRSLQVQAQARQAGLGLRIEQLFRTPTIAQLAAALSEAPATAAAPTQPFSLLSAAEREQLPADVVDAYPLAALQAGMLFHSELDSSASAYHDVFSAHLTLPYIRAAFETALERVQARHAALRTGFDLTSYSQPLQLVYATAPLPLTIHDLRDEPAAAQAASLQAWLAAERMRGFDWQRPPLWRLDLHRRTEQSLQLTLSFHHAILDGWSVASLLTELLSCYFALIDQRDATLPPLHSSYRDFIAQEQALVQSAAAQQFWSAQIAAASPTMLPRWPQADHSAPLDAIGTYDLRLSPEVAKGLRGLARAAGAPLKSVLLAAHLRVLSLLSGQRDVVTGLVVNSRLPEQDGAAVLGLFLNTVPFRLQLDGGAWRDAVRQTFAAELELFPVRGYPLATLQKQAGGPPVFETLFNYINFHVYQALSGRVSVLEEDFFEQTNYPLVANFSAAGTEGGVTLTLRYATATIPPAQAAAIAAYYERTLTAMATAPQTRYERATLLPDAERTRLLQLARPSQPLLPEPACLHVRFAQQAARTPEAVALRYEDQQLTYAELEARANQLAHVLRGLGVAPEMRVGLSVERSLDLVVGVLGILKAGGAYLPLDVRAPAERRAWMLQDAGAAVLITQQALLDGAPTLPVVCLDRDAALLQQQPTSAPAAPSQPQQLAYVIYTSGSTGQPKGVLVTHANVARLMDVTEPWLQPGPADVWTLFHAASFDFSVWELWGALLYGGRLVITPYLTSRSPEAFYDLLRREQVTVLNQTPSAFRQLVPVATAEPATALALRTIIFGGEALDPALLTAWYAHFGDSQPQLINMYGITETTVHVTYRVMRAADLQHGRSVIGTALEDLQLYVLDAWGQLAPIGTAGELYVGGAGVARGYLNRPALTAERFIPDPFSAQPGARLYRSGDLARALPDGDLEYLGRADQQVKLRGFRIELGEIAAALQAHEAVRDAVVLLRSDDGAAPRLVAYVVPGEPRTKNQEPGDGTDGAQVALAASVPGAELRSFLAERLPEYMIPAAFITLPALPLTANGKLDRRALPAPTADGQPRRSSFVAPRTPTEELLAGIWQHALGVAQVGVHDSFFELGGDSIRSLQVQAQARQAGLGLRIEQLFRTPTIAQLAAELSEAPVASGPPTQPFSLLSAAEREQLPADVVDAYPLAALQAGMLFHSQWTTDATAYHDVFSAHLELPFVEPAWEAALTQVQARHAALRTGFDLTSYSQPLQLVYATAPLPLTIHDLREQPVAVQAASLQAWLAAERAHGFDWQRPPLWRLYLHRRSDSAIQLTLSFHHVILDGWSVASLLTELVTTVLAYQQQQAPPQPKQLIASYRDFIAQEQALLASAPALDFWSQQLDDSTVFKIADWAGASSADQHASGRVASVALSAGVNSGLRQLARQAGVPLKSVLLAAHLRVIGLLSGQTDVLTGVVVNGRLAETDGEQVLGLFLNTAPFRLQLDGGSWLDLVQRTFAAERAIFPFRSYPLAEIQKRHGSQALFDTVFNYVNFHVYDALDGQVTVREESAFEQTNYPLTANFYGDGVGDNFGLSLNYDPAVLSEAQISAIGRYYSAALSAMASDPAAPVAYQSLLSAAEQQAIRRWNATAAEYPAASGVHQLFEAQARRTPDRIAVAYEGAQLTYAELDAQTNQLARRLQRLGVGPDVLVGISVKRSIELIVGLLGILKAGGAYLPLDPTYPQERLAYMLDNAQVTLLLTEAALLDQLPTAGVQTLCLDRDWPTIAQEPAEPVRAEVMPDNLAYVIYTSGSTGLPKGAMIHHRGLVNYLHWCTQAYAVAEGQGALVHSPIGFDLTVTGIFPPLLAGRTVTLLPEQPGVDQLVSALQSGSDLSLIKLTPAHLDLINQMATPEQLAGRVRALIIGGDALTYETIAFWQRHAPATRLINEYGPTETVVGCCVYDVPLQGRTSGAVPIGRPIANTQLYLLDRRLQPTPLGTPGELYIGGAGVARGYLGRPTLTAERFIPDPWSAEPGARLYKTGDLARMLPDGELEYLGRIDQQVKLRGFRIELGEIEAALLEQPAVRECVVLVREDTPGEKRLTAYVVPGVRDQGSWIGDEQAAASSLILPPSALRDFLAQRLPEYMIPAAFVTLDALPLTANGKLDRRALPAPDRDERAVDGPFVAPQSATEQTLAAIWATVLRLERVGIHDNFFALGGDSILSLQIVARANQAGLRLQPKLLFEHPTIAELALVVSSAPTIAAEQGLVSGPAPLTPIQQWFFSRELLDPEHYNQAVLLEVRRPLDPERLEQAVRRLYRQHDALRLRFGHEDGAWRQFHATPDDQPVLTRVDLSALVLAEQLSRLEAIAAETQRSLDLSAGPLLRVTLFEMGAAQPDRLLLVLHHLVVDGVSWRVLLEDLETGYSQLERGEPIALPAKTSSFQRWAERLREYGGSAELMAELPYWLAQLQPPTPRVPVDLVGGVNTVESARQVWIELSEEETRALLYDAPAAYQTQINDVLLTALAQAFEQWTDDPALLLDLEGHGREDLFDDIDLSRTVGWFTAIFPVRLDLGRLDEPGAALKAVKEQLRAIPNHGIGYGLLRYNSPASLADQLAALPGADLAFNYLGQTDQVMPDDGWFKPARESSGPPHSPRAARSHLIDVNGMISEGRLRLVWTYSANVHHQITIEQLAQSYLDALRALIAHCQAPDAGGYTPSDFPEAELDQDDMDKLFAKLAAARED